MANLHRHPTPGLLFRSDRWVQYAAGNFRQALADAGLVASMSRSGNCHDNGAMESIWSTLKPELVHRGKFQTLQQARSEIFNFIGTFNNHQRRRTYPGGLSPADFELICTAIAAGKLPNIGRLQPRQRPPLQWPVIPIQ